MSGNFRKNNFDLIRLFAAIQVAIVHAIHHFEFHHWTTAFKALRLFPGVPIFFVISGFLISASYQRNPNLIRYFKARFLRIYPALWVCLAFTLLSALIFIDRGIPFNQLLPWIVAQASFVQFYNSDLFDSIGVGVLNGSLWTIPVELQFYCLLPILILIFNFLRRDTNRILVAAILFFSFAHLLDSYLISRYNGWIISKLFHVTIIPHLYLFLVGIIIQNNLNRFLKLFQDKLAILTACYLIIAMLGLRFDFPVLGIEINPVSAILLGIIVVVLSYKYVPTKNWLQGYDISYGVYIYHMVVINIILQLGIFTNLVGLFVSLIVTIAIALASWILVEKPALSLLKSGKF